MVIEDVCERVDVPENDWEGVESTDPVIVIDTEGVADCVVVCEGVGELDVEGGMIV